jgi:hypothetical protein
MVIECARSVPTYWLIFTVSFSVIKVMTHWNSSPLLNRGPECLFHVSWNSGNFPCVVCPTAFIFHFAICC